MSIVGDVWAIVTGIFQLGQSHRVTGVDPSSIGPHGLTVARVRMVVASVIPMPIVLLMLVLLLMRLLVQLLMIPTDSASIRRIRGWRSRAR